MKVVHQAEDGTAFSDETECRKYESANRLCLWRKRLIDHIKSKCESTFSDDAGFSIIEPENVADYIEEYYDEITILIDTYVNNDMNKDE